MVIAVNTRLLLKDKLEGIGRFAYETLRRITKQHPEHRFVFIFDRPFDKEFIFGPNVTPVVVGLPARHPILFYLWFEFSVKKILKNYKADIFLSPDGYLSLSTDVKSIAVIHDLNFEHFPKHLPWVMSKYYRYFFPRFAQKAARIATVSEFSKKDIHQKYGISNEKIDVVYNGASDAFKPLTTTQIEENRKLYSAGAPYFIYVGSQQPRKNLANLLKAFEKFRKTTKEPVKLLLTGSSYYWSSEMKKALNDMNCSHDVIFTGRLCDKELSELMASALALTYVSYFEGFGIPIIEAMRSKVPVIASNSSSIPEIAGDAAILVNPFSVDSIANAMEKIYTDKDLRESLIQKGLQKQLDYNWDKSAELLWASIQKAIKS
ncbi:MAG: glycosyltransferase family 4 protein [Bacteroidetes bacterium]|nr:glycosyltransferase family 4 protein [Bacteroidota bacterium]